MTENHTKKQCNNDCGTCGSGCDDNIQKNKKRCVIKHKIAILSGKGGVGKSTVAVNLALALSFAGHRVGLLDADIHGPSIPTMLNLNNINAFSDCEGIVPVEFGNLKVMSIGFFLKNENDALIYRGPMKMGIINQFLDEVSWGDLDFLIIDLPPGTGDEALSICQTFTDQDRAIIVTTPQKISLDDVRKSIDFCHKLKLSILGIIENMSGFVCPKCSDVHRIFGFDGGKQLANDFNLPLLGEIPIDPFIGIACDTGVFYINAYAESETAKIFQQIIDFIIQHFNN